MKEIFLFILFLFPILTQAQDEPLRIVDEKPVLRSCLDVLDLSKREECSNQGILGFIYKSLIYPDTAVQQSIEGMVVVEMIISKKGRVIGGKLVKDIGGGCGAAVINVLRDLYVVENLWIPAVVDDIAVDYIMTIPVKFTLPEPPAPPLPFQVFGKDSIYHEYSSRPIYGDAEEDMEKLLQENLKYPAAYKDSCLAGAMEAQVIIGKRKQLQIVEVVDFENLGFDFQFELIQILNSTSGKWTPGKYQEEDVNVIHNIPAVFLPTGAGCAVIAEKFKQANEKATLANEQYAAGNLEEALKNWGAAIDLFPSNAGFRFMRGQALMENNIEKEQCCEDLNFVKTKMPLPPLLAGALPLFCSQGQETEEESVEVAPEEEGKQ